MPSHYFQFLLDILQSWTSSETKVSVNKVFPPLTVKDKKRAKNVTGRLHWGKVEATALSEPSFSTVKIPSWSIDVTTPFSISVVIHMNVNIASSDREILQFKSNDFAWES